MRKVLLFFWLITVTALITTSCAKEKGQYTDCFNSGKIIAVVSLSNKTEVKHVYSEVDPSGKSSGLKSEWESGDFFYALTERGDCIRFDLVSGAGETSGIFSADPEDVSIDAGTEWKAVLGTNASPSAGSIRCNYNGQTGNISELDEYDYIIAAGTGTEPEFNFAEGERLSYFMRIILPAGIRYLEYCTTANWKITVSTNTIVHDGHFNNSFELDLGSSSSAGDVCYLSIPATVYSNYINENPKGVIITVFNDDKTKSNGWVLSSDLCALGGFIGTFNLADATLIDRPLPEDAISFGSFSVIMSRDATVNSYNNLDNYSYRTIVSPSWAPFNLGADISSPSSVADLYGGSFCWGETASRTVFSLEEYTYNGSKTVGGLANFPSTQIGLFEQLSVTTGAENGTMKLQRISGTKYDAARVKWGRAWRMPKEEEWYIFTGSNQSVDGGTFVTESGFSTMDDVLSYYGISVRGRLFTKGGKSVFFPYAGWYGTGHAYFGARGFYWSDSRMRGTPSNGALTNNPLRITMTPSDINYGASELYYGLSIRPVLNEDSMSAMATAPSLVEDLGDFNISASSNLYGVVSDNNGNGIPGVTVSDGYTCVSTNASGVYQMTANANARTVNVTIPAAYKIPIGTDGRPAFFQYVNIPNSGAVRKDFTLTARTSVPDRFTIIAMSDVHVQNSTHLSRFTSALEDVQSTVTALGSSIPVGDGGLAGEVIGIAVGDQLTDNMEMAENVRSAFCSLVNASGNTVPVFYVIGNHDYDASYGSDYDCENTFISYFGPTNYSFDIGNAHVIVMDDIIRTGSASGSNGTTRITYSEGFTSEQVEWLREDIARVSGAGSKVVVFCCHAPLNTASGGNSGTQSAVMSALKNNFYNVHVLSGHTHSTKNNLYGGWAAKSGRSIYEHTFQSMSGYWWDADICYSYGSPAGYGVLTFGHDDIIAEYNKVTKESADFQMRVYNGSSTYNKNSAWDEMMYGGARGYKEYTWDSPATGKFVVRIWDAGSSNDAEDYWTVNLTYGGSTVPMSRVSDPIKDAAAASYVFNKIKGTYGDANGTTDQIWYSGGSFGTPFTITATHIMKSGWKATYTSTSYVGTNYKGFAYGERYD